MKTVLCVPGHDLKKVEGCRRYGADLILFDLEDSVPEGKKELAREIVKAHVQPTDAVRVNTGLNGYYDVRALRDVELDSVWLPKMEWWSDGVHSDHLKVVIVETPRMLMSLSRAPRHIETIGLRYITGLAFGAADFAAYMNVPADSPQIDYARQQVALAAAALGVPAYDSPCTTMRAEATAIEARRAHNLGYGWKGVVHPLQIRVTRSQGTPGEYVGDRQLVDEYERQSEAVVRMPDGRVIAPPMIRAARKRLEDSER